MEQSAETLDILEQDNLKQKENDTGEENEDSTMEDKFYKIHNVLEVSTAGRAKYGCTYSLKILNKIPQTKVILIHNH